MRRKVRFIFTIGLILMMLCMSMASASSADDDFSNYFIPQYVDPEDLGDESIPLSLLCGLAGIVTAGTIVVHKKRCGER